MNVIKCSKIVITAIVRRGVCKGGTMSVNNREELSDQSNPEKMVKGQKSKRGY